MDRELKDSDLNEPCNIGESAFRSEGVIIHTFADVSEMKETVYSDQIIIRTLPWRIMLLTKYGMTMSEKIKYLSIFVQCNQENNSSLWSCQASLEVSLINQIDTSQTITKKTKHLFCAMENDWGYAQFIMWKDLIDPKNGFIVDNNVVISVKIYSDAPHGICWDSKKLTGYVGLKNQGATCYMNSLLQTLFFTNKLRKAVYRIPTDNDDAQKSVSLALQRVFYDLQFSNRAVGTKKLTKSFGWETLDSLMQHDAQELCRVLLENMESKMKKTIVEDTIPKLLEGKMKSYIKCINVDYESNREESFYDIQLNVKGKKDVVESFKEYISVEKLDGENKYDAGIHGLQEAKKGVIFTKFPSILHLHLLRFQYDPLTDTNYKINERYEFYEELDLTEFIEDKSVLPQTYILHSVLVHTGDNHGGHYVVYVNPRGDGKWFKFDDDVVSQASKSEAIENNFGGSEDGNHIKSTTNAYMLAYIKATDIEDVLCSIGANDIPQNLIDFIEEQKQIDLLKRKERIEDHLYVEIAVIVEEAFFLHNGFDLFDIETIRFSSFKVLKDWTLSQVFNYIVDSMGYKNEQVRLWQFEQRLCQAFRPSYLDYEMLKDQFIFKVTGMCERWVVFMEISTLKLNEIVPLPSFDVKSNVLIFFKIYLPQNCNISYVGHKYIDLSQKWDDLFDWIKDAGCLSKDDDLIIYIESASTNVVSITNFSQVISQSFPNLTDGDIICFQKNYEDSCDFRFPTLEHYIDDIINRVEVLICDKNQPNSCGFVLTLTLNMTYNEVTKAISDKVAHPSDKVQLFRTMMNKDYPGHPIRSSFDGSLRDLIMFHKPKVLYRLYFQSLSIPLKVIENKLNIKCLFLSFNLNEEKELSLFVDKDGLVKDVLDEARKEIESKNDLRLVEIISNRIVRLISMDTSVIDFSNMLSSSLTIGVTKSYRIEECYDFEINSNEPFKLLPVVHFHRDIFNTFGIPFIIPIFMNDTFMTIFLKIQQRLELSDRDMEKIKLFVIIMGKSEPFPTNLTQRFPFDEIDPLCSNSIESMAYQPSYIGIEHLHHTFKRPRYHSFEKPIKIHN